VDKRLAGLLGAAAALSAVSGAQERDPPVVSSQGGIGTVRSAAVDRRDYLSSAACRRKKRADRAQST
jgi:hypothetical protein